MKKSLLIKSLVAVLIVVCSAFSAVAQISEGEPYSRTIRTGNRPTHGDWGIFIATPNLLEVGDMISGAITWRGLPLVNVKYYPSDNFEVRLGVNISKTKDKLSGEEIDGENRKKHIPVKEVNGESYYRLVPSCAYHFSSKNILDVYVGAKLPLGLSSEQIVSEYSKESFVQKRSSFEIGLGAFIGLQCFVADLPVAIGLEYGFAGMKYLGQKYKNVIVDEDGKEQTFYTTDSDIDGTHYSTLKSSNGRIDSDIRISISYFFK